MQLTQEQRAEISRANGRKSRGPKTAKGKSFSSRNALKHGLSALAPDPELAKAEFVRTKQLVARLRPQTDLELEMVCQIASDQALMQRIDFLEYPHLAAASTAFELGCAWMRFDRYKAKAENRSYRLLRRLAKARRNKNSTKRT